MTKKKFSNGNQHYFENSYQLKIYFSLRIEYQFDKKWFIGWNHFINSSLNRWRHCNLCFEYSVKRTSDLCWPNFTHLLTALSWGERKRAHSRVLDLGHFRPREWPHIASEIMFCSFYIILQLIHVPFFVYFNGPLQPLVVFEQFRFDLKWNKYFNLRTCIFKAPSTIRIAPL